MSSARVGPPNVSVAKSPNQTVSRQKDDTKGQSVVASSPSRPMPDIWEAKDPTVTSSQFVYKIGFCGWVAAA